MDILSHGLWAGMGAKAINHYSASRGARGKQRMRMLNAKTALLWGIFPDLFAFVIPFVILFARILFGDLAWSDWPHPDAVEPASQDALNIFYGTAFLYSISHSIVVFACVFGAMVLFKKRAPYEMLGWLLHILADIPTHSYRFYPTPALWPISDWKFNGISWSEPAFMAANYGSLVIAFFLLRRKQKNPHPNPLPVSRTRQGEGN